MKLYRSKSNGFAEEQDFRIIKNVYLFIRAKALYLEAVGLLRRKNISDAYNYLIFVKIVTKNLFAEASVMPSPKKEMINRWRADPNRSFRDQIIELRDAAIVKIADCILSGALEKKSSTKAAIESILAANDLSLQDTNILNSILLLPPDNQALFTHTSDVRWSF